TAHHWLVASPDGRPTVAGRCRNCGVVREFPSTSDESAWNKAPANIQAAVTAARRRERVLDWIVPNEWEA
ncbi:MAG: hypothetical protein AB7R89_25675, partial [Dehalococcoidia bacterium]